MVDYYYPERHIAEKRWMERHGGGEREEVKVNQWVACLKQFV